MFSPLDDKIMADFRRQRAEKAHQVALSTGKYSAKGAVSYILSSIKLPALFKSKKTAKAGIRKTLAKAK